MLQKTKFKCWQWLATFLLNTLNSIRTFCTVTSSFAPGFLTFVEGDRGGRNPGVMGAGSQEEAGEKRAADGIPKGMGARRNVK